MRHEIRNFSKIRGVGENKQENTKFANLVVSSLVVCNFDAKALIPLFVCVCALFCLRSFVLICALLPAFTCFCE